MKIIGISGSPRKGSNTDIIVGKVLEGAASKGAETEMVSITDLKLAYCTGCMQCRADGNCRLTEELVNDDLPPLLEMIERADGIVLGSPVYGMHLPGRFKNMFDRLVSQMVITLTPEGPSYACRIPGKRNSVVIATCGNRDSTMAASTLEFLKRSAAIFSNGGRIISEITVSGMMMPAQLTATREELSRVAANYNLPEQALDAILENQQSLMDSAFQDGISLASMDT